MNIREQQVKQHEDKRKKLFEGISINDKFLGIAGLKMESVRKAKTKSGKETDDLEVDYNGKTYKVGWSADSSGFKGTPYGIVFPGDEHFTFLSKSKKAKNLWTKLKPMIDKSPLTEGKKLKMPKTKEEAQDQAMEWQSEFSSKSMSWGEVIAAQQHFEKAAKKFGLTDEFQENGII